MHKLSLIQVEFFRDTLFGRWLLYVTIFSFVNICIDPPNYYKNDTSSSGCRMDESESFSELIIESLMDCSDIFPDVSDQNSEDENLKSKKLVDWTKAKIINQIGTSSSFIYDKLLLESANLFGQHTIRPSTPPPWHS